MLQDIYSQAQRQITTEKFYTLPTVRQKELLDSLYKTIILGLRALVLKHISIDHKDEIEIIINKQDDDALFLLGRQKIQDFEHKLQQMIDNIALSFTYDISN